MTAEPAIESQLQDACALLRGMLPAANRIVIRATVQVKLLDGVEQISTIEQCTAHTVSASGRREWADGSTPKEAANNLLDQLQAQSEDAQ